ncbi:MAG TPA: hypothetical protein VFT66_11825 [Roseiflexaceae bacterium]|jgi:hypothetical protein|nr:hypothetical protein [Roseiflexaceae bacterium]
MSGAVKSGLIFGVVGILATSIMNFLFGLCSPVVAAIIGGVAGYFGVRWSVPPEGIGKGVLAGTIAGALMLISSLAFVLIFFNIIRNDPQFSELINQAIAQQQGGTELSPDQVTTALNIAAPIAGFCLGLINLLASLAFGAVGGAIAGRNRPVAPTYQPPMGPPPMSPQ